MELLNLGVYLWEAEDGQIAAVLNQEGYGQAFLQIHPTNKTAELEEQMILLAEEKLRGPSRRGGEVLWIWCDGGDLQRQAILEQRGFYPHG